MRRAGAQLVEHHLQPRQRTHARDQRDFVDRLGEKIVGAGFKAAHPVRRLVERRHHHDRQMHRCGIGLEAAADLETVHARHHDVEQNDVAAAVAAELQRLRAVGRGDRRRNIPPESRASSSLRLGSEIVDDEDARGHLRRPSYLSARKEFTVSRNFATEIGFER